MTPARQVRRRNARGQGGRLRDEIVAAAVRLIDHGVSPLTLRAVAREAGIAAPSIYDHFSDIAEILAALRKSCLEDLDRAMLAVRDPLGDPVERLEAVCHGYLGWARSHPERYAVLFDAADSAQGTDLDAASVYGTMLASLAECARALRSESRDTVGDALMMWAGLHGLAGLRPGTAALSWPDEADLVNRLIRRLAQVRG